MIDHMPHGSIRQISIKLDKERGTVRGVLQGKWVNTDVLDASIEMIEKEIERLNIFVEDFKSKYQEIK